jgi:hypothetical protein
MSRDFTLWFGGVALIAGTACGAAQSNASTVELPSDIGELPKGMEDQYGVFAANCSKCHGLERPLTAPVTDHKHWERYVAKMMRTPGSGISAQEAPAILAFLFWYTDKRTGRLPDNQNAPPAFAEPELGASVAPAPAPAPDVQPPAPAPVVAPQGGNTP